jgi:hypothetical protein
MDRLDHMKTTTGYTSAYNGARLRNRPHQLGRVHHYEYGFEFCREWCRTALCKAAKMTEQALAPSLLARQPLSAPLQTCCCAWTKMTEELVAWRVAPAAHFHERIKNQINFALAICHDVQRWNSLASRDLPRQLRWNEGLGLTTKAMP